MGEISQRELDQPNYFKKPKYLKDPEPYQIGSFVGKSGVEKEMERVLTGKDGGYQVEVNAVGYKINIMRRIDPIPGHNVILTINAELQKTAEEALKGKVGAIVAVDPRNGKILTMASSPSFDPNSFSRGISSKEWEELINNPGHPLMNRCIQAVHPPGSTYKLVTAAAALEESLVTEDTSFFCRGIFKLGNRSFRCWKRPGHEKVSLVKGIAESCDVYFYQLGILLGPDLLAGYAKGFGFGAPTGITLKNEKSGFVPTSGWYRKRYGIPWQTGESLSIAIGQGSNLVTPLQIVMAYAAVANGGKLYEPYCIDRVITVEEEVIESTKPKERGSIPLSEKNRALLMQSLWEVVNTPVGTGTLASIPEKNVSGKTGTAQVVSLAKKKENADRDTFSDHAWFAAYAPGDEARIAVVVFIEHGGHGGSAAAPVARTLISHFFKLEEEGNV
jgi:penicillin-binding protein 2